MTTTPSTPVPAPAVRLAERLLGEVREEVRRADAKATQWVAALGAATVTVPAWWNADRTEPWLIAAAATCAAAAFAALALALLPRTAGAGDPRLVAYFGHIDHIGDPRAVRRHLEATAADNMPALVTQLCRLSRLAVLKYRCVRIGTLFGASAGALVLFTVF
ncbi:Pycsar system effector family protein [Paractinoplanes atraurantiacus]|uniref:Pycsar effector protein domain-containing protein n=1 Tax=Paractinoplanes atraurantiacus TaxID=1036182 RepID=A0A285J5R1_9ACTN|nr:Pycsar system effector family protein [Actinoplanes atraurantiacus]SNY55403.1 hypothetical protein SAMN05421748_116132 [Actinoplanes atraurantiacus]